MRRKTQIIGFKELERSFRELGKVPQTVATKSARSGAIIVLRAVRRNAPVDEGHLKKALVLKRERTKVRGKAVYQVTFSSAMNDELVKVSKDGQRSYYPASQEFGWLTVDGGYVPGYRYMRRSAEENVKNVERKSLSEAMKAIEKAMSKR